MWILIHQQPRSNTQSSARDISKSAVTYCLVPGRGYTVGRIACDLTILTEQSVSKHHATITVHAGDGSGQRNKVSIEDKSTFGSHINSEKLHNSVRELFDGDQIVFSQRVDFGGRYSLKWEPIVLCCSKFEKSLFTLKASVIKYSITVLDSWDVSVTHLIVRELRTTSKVLCALSKGVPIVGLSWVEQLIRSIEDFTSIPLPTEHMPPLSMVSEINDVNLFAVDLKRTQLFEGKRFYFLNSREYEQFSIPISYCSGISTLIDVSDVTFATYDRYAANDSIVVSGGFDRFCSVPGGTEFITQLELSLETEGKSLIPDSKIVHAIMQASTEGLFPQTPQSQYVTPPDYNVPIHSPVLLSKNISQSDSLTSSPKKKKKKMDHTEGKISCMFSLFDDEAKENSDSSFPTQPKSENTSQQLIPHKDSPPTQESSSLRKEGKQARKDGVLTLTDKLHSARDVEGKWFRTDSPRLHQIQSSPVEMKEGCRVLRKCFVKAHQMKEPSYLRPLIANVAKGTDKCLLKKEPNLFSSDEEDSRLSGTFLESKDSIKKFANTSSSPLLINRHKVKLEIKTTPKCKRRSLEKSDSTSKKSLLVVLDGSDSDDDKYLKVTPLK